jgi:hypothetical protein
MEYGLDTIIDDLSNLYPPEIHIVPGLLNMALINIMNKILVRAGARIPSGRGYPIVKNVIKVLFDYDTGVLKESQDRYSALSPSDLVSDEAPTITAGNAPTLFYLPFFTNACFGFLRMLCSLHYSHVILCLIGILCFTVLFRTPFIEKVIQR